MFKVWQKFKPYFIDKLVVKYAKHIQKRKTKKKEQLKNIQSMKSLRELDIEKFNILINSCGVSKYVETKFNIILNAIAL